LEINPALQKILCKIIPSWASGAGRAFCERPLFGFARKTKKLGMPGRKQKVGAGRKFLAKSTKHPEGKTTDYTDFD
jgi:hypothetical protein